MAVPARHSRRSLLERRIWHPFALQSLPTKAFVRVANKILVGEYGLINFEHGRKSQPEHLF